MKQQQKPKTNIVNPAQMPDVTQTAEQLLKLSITANEICFAIKGRENEISDLKSKLADIRAAYSDLKPKVIGILAPLE